MADKLDLARRDARLKQYGHLFELASNCWDRDWDVNGAAQDIFLDYVEALLDHVTLEEATAHAIVWEVRPATSKTAGDEIRLERRDGFEGRRWAITQRGYVLNKSGEWEYEPIPSSRTEEWLETTRWTTPEKAIADLESKLKGTL